MEDITKKLMAIKTKIEDAEKQESQLKGRLDAAYERLHKDFGVKTLPEAKKLLEKMDKELAQKEERLKADVEDLEKAYDWEGINVKNNGGEQS